MKNLTILLTVLFALNFNAFSQDDNEKDKEAIKKVILMAYQDGLQNEGDNEKVDKGFHPDFEMLGYRNGQMFRYHIKDWKANNEKKVENGQLPRKGDEKVKIKIPMVDVTGNAAVARLKFYVGDTLRFVDYMSLYKFEDGWKIVAKIYHTVE